MTLKNKTILALMFLALFFVKLSTAGAAAAANSAAFVSTDLKTQGNWMGVYGNDGRVMVGDKPSAPSYVTLTPQNDLTWTWAATTPDTRALQLSSGSGRIAATWYGLPTFKLDVNVTDGQAHQIALYVVDWDSKGRSETIQITDGSTGSMLDSRSASNFTGGAYYIWTVSGHVSFSVTSTSGPNAVISGAFFDPAAAASNASTTNGIAHYVTTDTSAQGTWMGAYGKDGFSLAGNTQSLPTYASMTMANQLSWTWAASTTDTRALQNSTGSGRLAATWYNLSTFSVDVNVTDGQTHQIALYAVDWDSKGRSETIQVTDGQSGAVLDSRSIFGFTNGTYVVWTISGHVKFLVTNSAGPNAVVSGVFFGTAGAAAPVVTTPVTTAPVVSVPPVTTPVSGSGSSSSTNCPPVTNAVSFSGIDSITEGAWKGIGNFNAPPASSSLVYGKDGVILPDTEGCDQACNPFPSYVAFGPSCVSSSTTGNTGAKPNSTHAYVNLVQGASSVMGAEPQNTSNTNYFQCNYTYSNPAAPWAPMVAWRPVVDTREISTWYTCAGIRSFNMEFSVGNSTHNFEVYVVDDQNGGNQLRSEEIQVLDGVTNAVLYDSGSFTNFTGGLYYKFSVTGHVKVKVINTATNGTNAVVSGVFFN